MPIDILEIKKRIPAGKEHLFAKELAEAEKLKRESVKWLEAKDYYRRTHGSEFFKPFWYQQKLIDYLHEGKKTVLLQGSNQIGKTLTGSCLVDSFCRGVQAWDGKPSIFGGRPTKGRIICTNWEDHASETIVPKLKEVIHAGTYEITKNHAGVEANWRFKNGSQFKLMTQKQETEVHESDTFDWAWIDEEIDHDKYVANLRGLIAREGVCIITMTSLRKPWVLREIVKKQNIESLKIACVVNVKMRENKSLAEESIQRFSESCDENERVARIEGGWIHLTGLVWPKFDRSIHVIKPFNIPPSWPVVAFIDPHWSMEFVVCFYAVSPMGKRYQIDEAWIAPNPKEVSYEIIRRKKTNSWRLERAWIDPLAKSDTEITTQRFGPTDDIFTTMKKELTPFGILLDTAKRSEAHKTSGITNINTWLMEEWGEPSLYFFNNCSKSIEEIEDWVKGPNGKPVDENDHACENLYRFSLEHIVYTDPMDKEFKFETEKGII